MNDKTRALDITIMGRSYKVTCSEDEREPLLRAVAYLDQKMNEIKDSGRVGSVERVAVMAALNIAHELLTAKSSPESVDGFDTEVLKRRMAAMQASLDAVLAPQEKLF
ncbi:MAG TPA: cell division protein ZapA [Burkholderiales bacterium]|jgi:cell division protein ZapA|nr:cell division protein ZapA [Burkholderiales bacterium]